MDIRFSELSVKEGKAIASAIMTYYQCDVVDNYIEHENEINRIFKRLSDNDKYAVMRRWDRLMEERKKEVKIIPIR